MKKTIALLHESPNIPACHGHSAKSLWLYVALQICPWYHKLPFQNYLHRTSILVKELISESIWREKNLENVFPGKVILTKQHMQVILRDLPLYFNKSWGLNNRQGNFHNLDVGTFPQYQENFMGRAACPTGKPHKALCLQILKSIIL